MEKNKGITLIALIITIILLLILAGISIASLTGSGLFEKAQQAKQEQENAQIKEEGILADYENKIDEYVSGNRETVTLTQEEYEIFKNQTTYSTEEKLVGTWIDGTTKIYQKTFETTLPAVGVDRVIDISNLNSNIIIDTEINYNKNNEYLVGNGYGYGNGDVYSGVWDVNSKKSITLRNTKDSGGSFENAQCFITIKYTKN